MMWYENVQHRLRLSIYLITFTGLIKEVVEVVIDNDDIDGNNDEEDESFMVHFWEFVCLLSLLFDPSEDELVVFVVVVVVVLVGVVVVELVVVELGVVVVKEDVLKKAWESKEVPM